MVVAGDDVAQRKPDPEAYLLALARLGVDHDGGGGGRGLGPGLGSRPAAAGLACVVVANAETHLATVGGRPLILDGFGPVAGVIADRFGVMNSAPGAPRAVSTCWLGCSHARP